MATPPTAQGQLVFDQVQHKTTPVRMLSSYPLRFLVPTKCLGDCSVDCCWVYSLNYGGGLVAGDNVRITCEVGSRCTVVLTTQGSTKVYKMLPRSATCSTNTSNTTSVTCQHFHSTVAASATLALLPDPFTCFRGANYQQIQHIAMARGANLVLVDWYTSGRVGRGESWVFVRLASETRITLGGELLLWEPLVLEGDGNTKVDNGGQAVSLKARMGPYHCFCLVVLVGPRLADTIQQISETQGRPTFLSLGKTRTKRRLGGAHQVETTPVDCVSSLCRLLDDAGNSKGAGREEEVGPGLAVKIAGKRTEDVQRLLSQLLAPLEGVVGKRPYSGV